MRDSFGAASTLKIKDQSFQMYRLEALDKAGVANTAKIPFSIRILLENLLRFEDDQHGASRRYRVRRQVGSGRRRPVRSSSGPRACCCRISPAFLLLCDLAAMRDALRAMGADPTACKSAYSRGPGDRSLGAGGQFGSSEAFGINALLEFQRNKERYALLDGAQRRSITSVWCRPIRASFTRSTLNIWPQSCSRMPERTGAQAYPDTLMGTDSHTTMINGLGVVGWGVGGIEAEACMLGQPISMLLPPVVGFKMKGKLAGRSDCDGSRADRNADASQARASLDVSSSSTATA